MSAPRVHIVVVLEELPVVRLVAESHEDEWRLRRWLERPAAARALTDAVADWLDELRRVA